VHYNALFGVKVQNLIQNVKESAIYYTFYVFLLVKGSF